MAFFEEAEELQQLRKNSILYHREVLHQCSHKYVNLFQTDGVAGFALVIVL